MPKIIGIDLGTTNSAAAIIEGGEPRIIENKEGGRITPSVVTITKSGERLVGTLAKRQSITNPENTIYSIKRLIGRRFNDKEVQNEATLLPYKIREAKNGGIEVKMGDRWFSPQEISAMILQKIKSDIEDKLGEKVDEAVITCPAYFDDSQRRATKEAGEIAGFKVKRVFNEPTAAALAYGFDKKKGGKIVVYDFGGGTLDVTVLEVSEDTIEVKATGGDTRLGGDDLDRVIMKWLISECKKESGIDISKDKIALQRLKDAAEKTKQELSTVQEVEINLPFITSSDSGPLHLQKKLTRSELESMVMSFVDRSIEATKRTLKESKLSINDINEVILVGGQTRMPLIQKRIKELFNKEPNKNINPDEVVAIGASIQAGILQGEVRDVLLLDVTPLSLGIETYGAVLTTLIAKNTTIPTKKSQVFTTAADGQTSVEIHVLQGERPMAQDNKTLARFILDGIPPSPRGVPQIEVSFDIDANGILQVSAKDMGTGKSQSIRIEASTGLSKEEIDKMKKDADLYAEDDRKKKDLADTKNEAMNLVYSAEKSLKDYEGKIEPKDKEDIQKSLKDLQESEKSNNVEDMKVNIKKLTDLLLKIGQNIYKQNPGQNGQNQNEPKSEEPQK